MSAIIIPFKKSAKKQDDCKCSFCGISKAKAKAMVQQGKYAICDKCISHAKQISDSCEVE